MRNFRTVRQLEDFLGKLDANYVKYAPALWDNSEVRCLDQLANADKEDLVKAGVVSAIHARDIQARSRQKLRGQLLSDGSENTVYLVHTVKCGHMLHDMYAYCI